MSTRKKAIGGDRKRSGVELVFISGHRPTARADVVFLHARTTDASSGQRDAPWNAYWPQLLTDDHSEIHEIQVSLVECRARTLPLVERARRIRDRLVSAGLGRRPIVFIDTCGGRLVKAVLRQCENYPRDECFSIIEMTRGIVFAGAPFAGSMWTPSKRLSPPAAAIASGEATRELSDWFARAAVWRNWSVEAYVPLSRTVSGVSVVWNPDRRIPQMVVVRIDEDTEGTEGMPSMAMARKSSAYQHLRRLVLQATGPTSQDVASVSLRGDSSRTSIDHDAACTITINGAKIPDTVALMQAILTAVDTPASLDRMKNPSDLRALERRLLRALSHLDSLSVCVDDVEQVRDGELAMQVLRRLCQRTPSMSVICTTTPCEDS